MWTDVQLVAGARQSRFIRMWEFYLASCEAAFASRYIGDVQMVLSRPLEPRPLPA